MNDADDVEDRAIARALGAESDTPAVEPDPALVDIYRDVLAELPRAEILPRDELEDRVVAAALARRPAADRALDGARARRARRVRVFTLAGATAAAALVIGLIATGRGSTAPTATGRITPAGVARDDVAAILRVRGTRAATIPRTRIHVALAPTGPGEVYGIAPRDAGPFRIGLVSARGSTTLGPTTARGGAIAFTVDHPERVVAVTLEDDGRPVGRAELTSG